MATRVLKKQLAGEEDLFISETTENQERAGGSYPITGMRYIRPCNSLAELQALDPLKFPKVSLHDGVQVTFYEYDSLAGEYKAVDTGAKPLTYATVEALKTSNARPGDYVNTVDYYSTQRGGGASYLIKTTAQAAADGDYLVDGEVNHLLAGGNNRWAILQQTEINLQSIGYTGVNDLNDTATILNNLAIHKGQPVHAKCFIDATQDSQVTINISRVKINFSGKKLTFTNDGIGIILLGEDVPPYTQDFNGIEDLELINDVSLNPNSTAIRYQGEVGSSSRCSTKNVISHGFGFGDHYSNRGYLVQHNNRQIWRCKTAIEQPSGLSDAGENIKYIGGTIFNNELAISALNPNGNFKFIGTSIDYNEKIATISNMLVTFTDCHVEGADWAVNQIDASNQGALIMQSGWFLSTTNGNNPCDQVVGTDSTSMVYFNGVKMNNIRTQTGRFSSGAGSVVIERSPLLNTPQMTRVLNDTQSLVADGSFEQSSIVDDIFITDDTAAITDRFTGANISLEVSPDTARSFSKSLKYTKTFGGGSVSGFALVAVKVRPQEFMSGIGYVRHLLGASSGNVTINYLWMKLRDDNNDTPTIKKVSNFGTETFTVQSGVDSGWVEFGLGSTLNRAPAWATHFVVKVSGDAWAGNGDSIYFDDLNFNVLG